MRLKREIKWHLIWFEYQSAKMRFKSGPGPGKLRLMILRLVIHSINIINEFAEVLHRLLHQRDAPGKVHARGASWREVQTVENRRVHSVRVLHNDAHRLQHDSSDDEGALRYPSL